MDSSYFDRRITEFGTTQKVVSRKLNFVGTVRVILFLLFLVVFVYFINARELLWAGLSSLVFVIGFVALVIQFNRLRFNHNQLGFLIKINEQEKNRLENDFTGIDSGEEFKDLNHAYEEDLDIFGESSVFQLLNRTSTIPGKKLLADRLLGNDAPANHKLYHKAVSELATNQELIQEYQALGMHFEFKAEDYESFEAWLNSDEKLSLVANKSFLLILIPSLFLLTLVVASILSITYYTLLPIIVLNLYLLGVNHAKTSKVVEQTSVVVNLLKTYLKHIRLLQRQQFDSELINSLQYNLHNSEQNAEVSIKKLSRLLDQLQARTNVLHVFINVPLILDLQWMSRLNEWKLANKEQLQIWMNTMAEFEVLVSLSGTSLLNPGWQFPDFANQDYVFEARELGHPLINAEQRVVNDFSLNGAGKSMIITGPNMAGKSTFLRTIALNVVLAQMGAPVCAGQMTVSHQMRVFTAMRTQDNLSQNISSFYAELDRIKQLLGEINSGARIFYFLDELLKGTNSADRHKGADALVRQLIALNVSGFVSTHDIELGELTRQLPEVSNYSFESIITDGQINFDYKIREGICSSFNATELMRQMGIRV